MACSLRFYSNGFSFRVVFGQQFWVKSPSWWCMPCSAKIEAREKDSGRWSDMWCLLLIFPDSSVGCGLLVTCSLPRPHVVTTHANGYYGAWPGWAISVSVLPLTIWFKENIKFDIKSWYTKPADLSSILSTYDLLLSESIQWEGQLDVHNHVFVAVFFRPLTHLQKSLQPLSLKSFLQASFSPGAYISVSLGPLLLQCITVS